MSERPQSYPMARDIQDGIPSNSRETPPRPDDATTLFAGLVFARQDGDSRRVRECVRLLRQHGWAVVLIEPKTSFIGTGVGR